MTLEWIVNRLEDGEVKEVLDAIYNAKCKDLIDLSSDILAVSWAMKMLKLDRYCKLDKEEEKDEKAS